MSIVMGIDHLASAAPLARGELLTRGRVELEAGVW